MIKNKGEKNALIIGLLFLATVGIAHLLTSWYTFEKSLWIILGGFCMFFLPGFLLTVFLSTPRYQSHKKSTGPRHEQSLDWLERITLSALYSISIITIVLMIAIGCRISLTPTIVLVAAIAINSLFAIGISLQRRHNKISAYAGKH